ncbi:MAG TPA: hypothetical protein VFX16_27890 [Pseudonocardiaceae bacterium]|nr:hypothetical protein [Pseudonocardiaceae bacterium]
MEWSDHAGHGRDGHHCVRLTGVPAGADVVVRPAGAAPGLPATAGRLVADGDDLCWEPRFPFLAGTTYTVAVDGVVVAELVREPPVRSATTEVVAVYPSGADMPLNLLRHYVWFSAPMSEGHAAAHVRLVDDTGEPLAGALLPTEHELWDVARRRLTVLLDPARIKRGLVGHGYPLRSGTMVRLVVDSGFLDATGSPLRTGAGRTYRVGGPERRRVEPGDWQLTVSADSLGVGFGRPLDHGLLSRCLRVLDPAGVPVPGGAQIGPGEQSWRYTPDRPWVPGVHHLVVDPILEDVAGNSVSRVFDRDLTNADDDGRRAEPVRLPFEVRQQTG